MDVLTSLLSDDEMKRKQKSNRQFSQLCDDMVKIYSASFEAGLEIERYKFGGFCLVNRSGRTIKSGVIENTVGLLGKKPKNRELDDWSVTEGEKSLVGVARWANQSCRPNCEFYVSGVFNGRPCVRLRALHDIRDGSELLTFCSANYCGDGNVNCLYCHDDLYHGVECTQEYSSPAQNF